MSFSKVRSSLEDDSWQLNVKVPAMFFVHIGTFAQLHLGILKLLKEGVVRYFESDRLLGAQGNQ